MGLYVRSDAVNPANHHIGQMKMDAVGRLGGHSCARTLDQFDLVTPSPACRLARGVVDAAE